MTTKLFPLSAFVTILVGSFFKFFRAFLSSVLIFLCCGRRARSRMLAVFVRIISFVSSGSFRIADSMQTMFLYGIRAGVIENVGHFSSNERSAMVIKGLF